MADACRNCKFFHAAGDTNGECRHDPPAAAMIGPQQIVGFWAPTAGGNWCGKFEKALVLVSRGHNQ